MIYMKLVGGPVFQVEFSEGLTVGQALQAVKDENALEFRSGYTIQDTITGRQCDDSENCIDGRLYFFNTFIVRHPEKIGT